MPLDEEEDEDVDVHDETWLDAGVDIFMAGENSQEDYITNDFLAQDRFPSVSLPPGSLQ